MEKENETQKLIKDLFLKNVDEETTTYEEDFDENNKTKFIKIYKLKGNFDINTINSIMVKEKYYNHEIFFYPCRTTSTPNVVIMIKEPNYNVKLNKLSNSFYYSIDDKNLNKIHLEKHKNEPYFETIEKIYYSYQILDSKNRYQTLINVKSIDPSNNKTIIQLLYPNNIDLSISLIELNKMINYIDYITDIEIDMKMYSINITLQKNKKRKREEEKKESKENQEREEKGSSVKRGKKQRIIILPKKEKKTEIKERKIENKENTENKTKKE